ncbi:MAG: hypothetical protein WC208_16145 [Gallionella sp.]|jgi:hypothetical protein
MDDLASKVINRALLVEVIANDYHAEEITNKVLTMGLSRFEQWFSLNYPESYTSLFIAEVNPRSVSLRIRDAYLFMREASNSSVFNIEYISYRDMTFRHEVDSDKWRCLTWINDRSMFLWIPVEEIPVAQTILDTYLAAPDLETEDEVEDDD